MAIVGLLMQVKSETNGIYFPYCTNGCVDPAGLTSFFVEFLIKKRIVDPLFQVGCDILPPNLFFILRRRNRPRMAWLVKRVWIDVTGDQ
jgi:hypothetical protein